MVVVYRNVFSLVRNNRVLCTTRELLHPFFFHAFLSPSAVEGTQSERVGREGGMSREGEVASAGVMNRQLRAVMDGGTLAPLHFDVPKKLLKGKW